MVERQTDRHREKETDRVREMKFMDMDNCGNRKVEAIW